MEPITTTAAVVGVGKLVENVVVNDGDPGKVLPYALLYAASMGMGMPSLDSAAAGVADTMDEALKRKVADTLKERGQEILDVASEHPVTPQVNAEGDTEVVHTITTVDERYKDFGHVLDVGTCLKNGEIPSAKQLYLALLDIIDAIDCGLTGSTITLARLKDHLHEQKVVVTTHADEKTTVCDPTTTESENPQVISQTTKAKKVTEVTKTDTTVLETDTNENVLIDKKQVGIIDAQMREVEVQNLSPVESEGNQVDITEGRNMYSERNVHEISMYVAENDGRPQLIASRRETMLGDTTEDFREEKEHTDLIGRLFGNATPVTTTSTVNGTVTQMVEELDTSTGQMVVVQKNKDIMPTEVHSGTEKVWDPGWVTYVPLGSLVDIGCKARAGFAISRADFAKAAFDVGATLITAGVGAAVIKGGSMAAARVAVNKLGGKAVASLANRATISGIKAVRKLGMKYDHLGKVFSEERVLAGSAAKVHNPLKKSFCTAMERLARIDVKHGTRGVKDYLQKEFAAQGEMGTLRARQLEAQFRGLKQNGLLTLQNRKLLAQGKSPLNLDGERLDLDHIIPQSLEKSLKADPSNLSFLGHMKNVSKSNHLTYRSMQKAHQISSANPAWRPSAPLQDAMRNYIRDNPSYDANWTHGLM